jgi:hypothetical protein
MSTQPSPKPRFGSIPPPVHPSRKRQACLTPDPHPPPSKKPRKSENEPPALVHASSGWIALKAPPSSSSSRHSAWIRVTPEVEELQDQGEIPNSSQSAASGEHSRSPSPEEDDEEPETSPCTSPVLDENATTTAQPEDIWMIDGLDIHAVMKKGSVTKFTTKQDSKILLWMKINETRGLTGHTDSFKKLLADLGFSGKGHTKEVEDVLKVKVKGRVHSWYAALKKKGILEDVEVEDVKFKDNLKVKFADYTSTWLHKDWDGNIEVPTSWLLNTVEVEEEFESISDGEGPEIFVVEEKPAPKKSSPKQKKKGAVVREDDLVVEEEHAPKKSPKQKKGAVVKDDDPVIDFFSGLSKFYNKVIGDAKEKDDARNPGHLLNRKTLTRDQWNVAAVQHQYAGIEMSQKLIVEKGQNDEEILGSDEENIYTATPIRHHTPTQRNFTAVEPDGLYAMVDSQSPESSTKKQLNTTTKPSQNLQSPHALSTPSHSDLTPNSNDYPSAAINLKNYISAAEEGQEIQNDEEHFADEEDNATDLSHLSDSSTPYPTTHQNACLACNGNRSQAPHEIIPLTCAAYPSWKSQLRAILLTQGTWGIITGETKFPAPFVVDNNAVGGGFFDGGEEFESKRALYEKEVREWEEKLKKVMGWMLLTMGKETREVVESWGFGMGEVNKVWERLRDEFEEVVEGEEEL